MIKLNARLNNARLLLIGAVFLPQAFGQTASPLVFIETIPVPNWTNTCATKANLDLLGFTPWTRVTYVSERANLAIPLVKSGQMIAIL